MNISGSGWSNSLLLLTITLVKHLRNVQLAFTDSKKMKHSTRWHGPQRKHDGRSPGDERHSRRLFRFHSYGLAIVTPAISWSLRTPHRVWEGDVSLAKSFEGAGRREVALCHCTLGLDGQFSSAEGIVTKCVARQTSLTLVRHHYWPKIKHHRLWIDTLQKRDLL